MTWQLVNSTTPPNPIPLIKNNGYICTGIPLVTFILPLAAAVGDVFSIISLSSKFTITQNANQFITVGPIATTAGSGGFVDSNTAGDALTLIYVANNQFQADGGPQGTLTLW